MKSRKNLYIVAITYMLCYAAYEGVITLESSMNIEEGLGTASVMVVFITSTISCIFIVPFLIDFFGAKAAVIIGEVGVLVYIAANFYPSWYTLIPAAVFHGITESAPWAGTSVYVTYLGEQRHIKQRKKIVECKTKESYIYRFFAQFFAIVFFGDVLGFSVVFLVLTIFKNSEKELQLPLETSSNSFNDTNTTTYNTTKLPVQHVEKYLDLAKCGASDCQADYIYNSSAEEMEKFNPNPTSTYVLLSLFVAVTISAVIVQMCCLDDSPAKFTNEQNDKNTKNSTDDLEEGTMLSKLTRNCENIRHEVKDVFQHIISPLHLLVAPMLFYYGLFYGYTITEYTRAYVSCTLGIEQLGIALTLLAITAGIYSAACSKIILCIGRNWFIVILACVHFIIYFMSLFWKPHHSNTWMAYFIGAWFGIGEASIVNATQGLMSLYFEERQAIAFSVKNCLTNLGIVVATGWSTSLCVYVKIYLQMAFLIIALVCLIGAELLYRRTVNYKQASQINLKDQHA